MFKTLRSYFWWTYERGSFHYDVMVTLILIFMFVGPRFIDFKDRPVETVALHSSEVLVKEAGTTEGDTSRFIYQIRADDIDRAANGATTDAAIRDRHHPHHRTHRRRSHPRALPTRPRRPGPHHRLRCVDHSLIEAKNFARHSGLETKNSRSSSQDAHGHPISSSS